MDNNIPNKEVVARIEAALYSSGRPMTLEELSRATGINSNDKIRKIVLDIMKKVNSVFNALEIRELDDGKFVFQLKSSYIPIIKKFAKQPLISSAALKTLSYIVYEQPITSKRLAYIRGTQAYTHVKFLEQLSFIEHENLGRLKVYRTTRKFQEYFGISDVNMMKESIISKS